MFTISDLRGHEINMPKRIREICRFISLQGRRISIHRAVLINHGLDMAYPGHSCGIGSTQNSSSRQIFFGPLCCVSKQTRPTGLTPIQDADDNSGSSRFMSGQQPEKWQADKLIDCYSNCKISRRRPRHLNGYEYVYKPDTLHPTL